mgnify:CR=1 FL=1
MVNEETKIKGYYNDEFVVTNRKIVLDTIESGSGVIKHIPLEHITSSTITKKSIPILLYIAGLLLLTGIFLVFYNKSIQPFYFCLFAAFLLVGFYYTQRKQILKFASPSSSISIKTDKLGIEEVVDIMCLVEETTTQRLIETNHK